MSRYTTHTDEQLLQLLKVSDDKAFTEIFNRYWSLTYRDAMKVLKNDYCAEDVVQELFESLWKRRESLQVQGALPAYLRTATRYIALHKIEKNISLYPSLELLADSLSTPSSIQSQIDFKDLKENLDLIISTLPEKMKNVYLLSREEELPHRQIAEQLDISERTVKKQVHNALKIIKKAVDKAAMTCLIYLFF